MHPLLTLQSTLGNQSVSRLVVQRASESATVIGAGTQSYRRRTANDDAGNAIQIIKSATARSHKQGESVTVDYAKRALTDEEYLANKADASGVQGQYALIPGTPRRFIKIAGLRPQPSTPPEAPKKTLGGLGKRTGQLLEIGSTATGLHDYKSLDKIGKLDKEIKSLPDGPEKTAKKAEKDQLSDSRTGIDLTAASLSGGVALFGLIGSIEKLIHAKGGWKRAEAAMDVTQNIVGVGGSVANIVDQAGKNKYGSSAGFGGQAAGAATGVEKSTAAAGAIGAAGEILAGIIAAVKRVKAIVNMARTKHKVGAKDKANMAIDTVKDAVGIAKSAVSATKSIVDITSSTGASEALKTAIPGLGIAIAALDMIQRAFKFVVDAMNKGRARAQKAAMKLALGARLGFTITKKAVLAYKNTPAYQGRSSKTKEAIEDYLLARELQDINTKRMTRQGIKIALNANDIIADALNIGGVTAAAGLSLKIIGGATKLILPAFRRFKQWGRDQAAKKAQAAGGQVKGFFSMFNHKKSSSAKDESREKMINRMFDHLVKWWKMAEGSDKEKAQKAAQGARVKDFFKAAGMSWTAVQTYEDANELAGDLDSALKARE